MIEFYEFSNNACINISQHAHNLPQLVGTVAARLRKGVAQADGSVCRDRQVPRIPDDLQLTPGSQHLSAPEQTDHCRT